MKFSAVFIAAALLAAGPAGAQSWSCSASGIISGSYDGGSAAYIHLQEFPDGGTYPVQKQGKRATGTTKNGTKFSCVQK
jgi:hypothetical protein